MLSTTHAVFHGLQQQLKLIISGLPASADLALKQGLIHAHLKLSDYFTKFNDSGYYIWAARSFILFMISTRVGGLNQLVTFCAVSTIKIYR